MDDPQEGSRTPRTHLHTQAYTPAPETSARRPARACPHARPSSRQGSPQRHPNRRASLPHSGSLAREGLWRHPCDVTDVTAGSAMRSNIARALAGRTKPRVACMLKSLIPRRCGAKGRPPCEAFADVLDAELPLGTLAATMTLQRWPAAMRAQVVQPSRSTPLSATLLSVRAHLMSMTPSVLPPSSVSPYVAHAALAKAPLT